MRKSLPAEADRGPDPEAVLLARMARGDRAALGELYRQQADAVFRLALRMLHDEGEAYDLVHDVFLEAWRRASSFDSRRGNGKGWLLLRARSRALDRLKAPARRRGMSLEDAEPPPPSSARRTSRTEARVDAARLPDALAHVSELEREVLCLGYFEGLSSSEIAERVGVPIGTVKSRTRSALEKIRALWSRQKEQFR